MVHGGMRFHSRHLFVLVVLALGLSWLSPAFAQEPKSSALAKELADLIASKKIDSIAAQMPGDGSEFAGALAFPSQLVVVWAKTAAPAVMRERLLRHQYRELYIDLNSASIIETRHMVTDLGADGLRVKPASKSGPADSHDLGSASMRFDGNWKEDKMSEKDYMKAHEDADSAYMGALAALIAELKKPS